MPTKAQRGCPPACRNDLTEITQTRVRMAASQPAHAGLLLARYLDLPVPSDDRGTENKLHPEARLRLFENAIAASANAGDVYKRAFERWKESFDQTAKSGHKDRSHHKTLPAFRVPCAGRMVIGLGNASPIEAGITLHHTYGVPTIPGSALKGLAAHYCDVVWGNRPVPEADCTPNEELGFRRCRGRKGDQSAEDRERVGKFHRALFGTTEDAGHIIFHDAWIDPGSLGKTNHAKEPIEGLVRDIMTPHHGDYYAGKEVNGQRVAPTDFDSPVPIPFLSVSGRFWIGLSCDAADDRGALGLTAQLVKEALQHWGIGGKTSSSYGRMMQEP